MTAGMLAAPAWFRQSCIVGAASSCSQPAPMHHVPQRPTLLQRVSAPFREFGPVGAMLYLADRLLSATTPRWRVFAYELMVQPVPAPAAARATTIEVRQLPPGDPALAGLATPAAVQLDRFAQDASCLGAFKRGELIAYMWFCPGRYAEDEVRCDFVLEPAEHSVFDFDFYVLPQHRLGRAFAVLWQEANRHLHARGIRWSFSRVSRFNLASLRAHAHLGATRIGRALFVQFGAFQAAAFGSFPYLHLSLHRRCRLRLRPAARTAPSPVIAGDAAAAQVPPRSDNLRP